MSRILDELWRAREAVARRYAVGEGIEVGAAHNPFPLSQRARATYVDRLTKADLLVHYPELKPQERDIVEPGIVDDGETLGAIGDRSQDFVIASHFLEHCQNPLATLRNHFRVLRPGGALILVVPNSEHSAGWDRGRELTTFDHLVRDDREGPQVSRAAHYREWVEFAGKMTGETAEREQKRLMDLAHSIHFHCWTPATFPSFLLQAIAYNTLDGLLVRYQAFPSEMIAVLERLGPDGERCDSHADSGETPGDAAAPDADEDSLRTERAHLAAEQRQLTEERDRIQAERGRLQRECHDLETDRRRLAAELDGVCGSATFRLRDWVLRSPTLSTPARLLVRVAKGRLYR